MKGKKKKEVNFLLFLTSDLREKIKIESYLTGYSMNDFILNCVKKRIKKADKKFKKELTESN